MKKIIFLLLMMNIISLGFKSYAQINIPKENIPSDIPLIVRQEIEKLYSPDAEQRLEAVHNLEKMGLQAIPATPFLIELFKDSDYRVKGSVIFVLGGIRDRQVEEFLIAAMKDKDPEIREGAVSASVEALMRGMKNPKVTGQLVATLHDENPKVRREAVLALEKAEDPSAVEPLIETLKDADSHVRWMAATALGKIKDARAVEPLIAVMSDKDSDVRTAAIIALGKIDNPRIIEPIISALKDSNSGVRRVAIIVSGSTRTPRAVVSLIEALNDTKIKNTETQQQAIYALQKINDPRVVDALIVVLNDTTVNEGIRNTIIRALGELKDPRAVGPLINELKILNSKGDNKDFNTQIAKNNIASFLREITHNDFGTDIKKWQEWWTQVQEDKQPAKTAEITARKEKLKAFGANKDKSAIPLIIESLKDKNPDVRTSASWALANIADTTTVPTLIEALKDEDYRVRGNAIWGLGKIGGNSVILPVAEALKDPINEVRQNAIAVLASFGKPAVSILLKKLEEERLNTKSQRAREIYGILSVFNEIGDKSTIPYIYKLIKDKDDNVTIAATTALCLIGDEATIYDLMKMAMQEAQKIDKDKAEKIAKENIDGLTQLAEFSGLVKTSINISSGISNAGEPVIPTLLKALSNKDWEVRYMAASLLQDLCMSYRNHKQTVVEMFISKLDDENPEVRRAIKESLNFITDVRYKTGQDFGEDKEKWKEWWEQNKEQFK